MTYLAYDYVPELVTGLMFKTRSRPRSEWLTVLEWSLGGVASGWFGDCFAAFWREFLGGRRAVFERSSGRLGAVSERSWDVLGWSGGVLAHLGVVLGRLGAALEPPRRFPPLPPP